MQFKRDRSGEGQGVNVNIETSVTSGNTGNAAEEGRVRLEQASQQATPGKVDSNRAGEAVQFERQILCFCQHVEGVGQTTTTGLLAELCRVFSQVFCSGVYTDMEGLGVRLSLAIEVTSVTSAEVYGNIAVGANQPSDLADVYREEFFTTYRNHGISFPGWGRVGQQGYSSAKGR